MHGILRQPSSASFSIEGGLSGLMSVPHLLRRGTEYADIVALGAGTCRRLVPEDMFFFYKDIKARCRERLLLEELKPLLVPNTKLAFKTEVL